MYLQTFLSGDVGLVIGDLMRGLVFFIKTMGAGKMIHKIQKGKNTDFFLSCFPYVCEEAGKNFLLTGF